MLRELQGSWQKHKKIHIKKHILNPDTSGVPRIIKAKHEPKIQNYKTWKSHCEWCSVAKATKLDSSTSPRTSDNRNYHRTLSIFKICCSLHEVLQTRILEWVAFHFSRASSQSRVRTWVCCTEGDSLPWATTEAQKSKRSHKKPEQETVQVENANLSEI